MLRAAQTGATLHGGTQCCDLWGSTFHDPKRFAFMPYFVGQLSRSFCSGEKTHICTQGKHRHSFRNYHYAGWHKQVAFPCAKWCSNHLYWVKSALLGVSSSWLHESFGIYHNLSRYHVFIFCYNLALWIRRFQFAAEMHKWNGTPKVKPDGWTMGSSYLCIEGDFGVLQKGRYHWRCDILPASYCFYVSKSFKFNLLTGGRLPPTGLSCPMCPIIKSKWKQVSCWLSLYPGNCTYWQLRL